jgi:hypothetical protein
MFFKTSKYVFKKEDHIYSVFGLAVPVKKAVVDCDL